MVFCNPISPNCDTCFEVVYGNCNDILTLSLGLDAATTYYLNLTDKFDVVTPLTVVTDGSGDFTITQTWTEFFGGIEITIFSDAGRTALVTVSQNGIAYNCVLLLRELTGQNEITTTFSATGGVITFDGLFTVHTFLSSGTFTPNGLGMVDYLVVGGGGSGGSSFGAGAGSGGGGAGGFLTALGFVVTAQAFPITVGAGGPAIAVDNTIGVNGSDSIFDTVIAIGGGGGGRASGNGSNGGSGGGASAVGQTAGTGIVGQGFAGGISAGGLRAGGGGGAGEVGKNGTAGGGGVSGDGGDGLQSDLSGVLTFYAGGGGGGETGGKQGAGGQGGGGSGLAGSNDATPNTGGGGGGHDNGNPSGAGGSGIVIIRYLT